MRDRRVGLRGFGSLTSMKTCASRLRWWRIGTSDTTANYTALIEPPGFLMLNYGRNTFLVTIAAHIAYGAIVGWSFRS